MVFEIMVLLSKRGCGFGDCGCGLMAMAELVVVVVLVKNYLVDCGH